MLYDEFFCAARSAMSGADVHGLLCWSLVGVNSGFYLNRPIATLVPSVLFAAVVVRVWIARIF
jgi:hypothetical protein